jgi:hypothetical protein
MPAINTHSQLLKHFINLLRDLYLIHAFHAYPIKPAFANRTFIRINSLGDKKGIFIF